VSQPPLSDLRTLAVGFKDLATTAATPPPLPTAPPPAAAVQAVVPTPPPPPKVYSNADPDIVSPVALRQELPPYPGQVPIARQGMIEVLIDETGAVESAIMRISVSPTYDNLALAAARNWRFRPAMLNGAPVKYRKAVQVTIKPTGPR
jgi:protein TonB